MSKTFIMNLMDKTAERTLSMTFWLTTEERMQLRIAAAFKNKSASKFVRHVVKQAVDKILMEKTNEEPNPT